MPSPRLSCRVWLAAAVVAALLPAASASAETSGAAYAWGDGRDGAVGNRSTGSVLAPAPVGGFTGSVAAVASGDNFSLILQNGTVYACGNNAHGQLGNGSTANSGVPVAVSGLSGVTAVAGGGQFALAIQNGAAYAWGYGLIGQLGNNSAADSAVPVAVTNLSSGVTAVAAGGFFALAVRNGSVLAWGDNSSGELGNGSTNSSRTPTTVSGLRNVTAISAGAAHGLAVAGGAAYSWGDNHYGQLGINSTAIYSTLPSVVQGLGSGVTAVAAGLSHGLAVQNGKVYAWGDNSYGQLGNGTSTASFAPIAVAPSSVKNITAVAAGSASSYALASDGSLWVWGLNNFGQTGLGNSTGLYATPQHLLPPGGYRFAALDIDSGGSHVFAVLTATTAFFDGQVPLGNGAFYLALPNGNPFGYYSYLADPKYVYHFDLGYEYGFDAADGQGGVYLYDFKSNGFFYTSPAFSFPYLYDFALDTVLYYYPDPGNPQRYNTNGTRYFYRFDTGEIFSK